VESVEEADVWEILTYMSWKAAKQEYENKYQEVEQQRLKQKG
jgi:hypothetical protein